MSWLTNKNAKEKDGAKLPFYLKRIRNYLDGSDISEANREYIEQLDASNLGKFIHDIAMESLCKIAEKGDRDERKFYTTEFTLKCIAYISNNNLFTGRDRVLLWAIHMDWDILSRISDQYYPTTLEELRLYILSTGGPEILVDHTKSSTKLILEDEDLAFMKAS